MSALAVAYIQEQQQLFIYNNRTRARNHQSIIKRRKTEENEGGKSVGNCPEQARSS